MNAAPHFINLFRPGTAFAVFNRGGSVQRGKPIAARLFYSIARYTASRIGFILIMALIGYAGINLYG